MSGYQHPGGGYIQPNQHQTYNQPSTFYQPQQQYQQSVPQYQPAAQQYQQIQGQTWSDNSAAYSQQQYQQQLNYQYQSYPNQPQQYQQQSQLQEHPQQQPQQQQPQFQKHPQQQQQHGRQYQNNSNQSQFQSANTQRVPIQQKLQTQAQLGTSQSNVKNAPYVKSSSPLNDFGDMGAAVRKFADDDPSKHHQNQSTSAMSAEPTIPRQEERNKYRLSHGLSVWDNFKQEKIPEPFEQFENFNGLSRSQLDAFYSAGFQAPTPIQAQTWPIAMKDRDVVSIAKTGSGKTLAFLLPAYRKISSFSRGSQRGIINALVLAPTRELATQIQEEANRFGSVAGYHSACAYGGAPKREQLQAINSGISVLVATPGRLNDFLDSNQVNLSSVFYLVLDEADRMLDMGFEPQIRSIIRRIPRKRQTLMFSATWPEEVRRLANDFLHQPIHIRLGGIEAGLQANENIMQHLILLRSGEDKDSELINLIKKKFKYNRHLVLIFVARKNTCDFVANMLNRVGIQAAAMHGDRDQQYREKTLAAFRNGSCPIMVATDVASRGIDVKGISAVINYDLANSSEDYVHRIGRTGRAGMEGESYTFLTHSNDDIWKAMGIVEVMAKTGQYPPQEVQEIIDRLKQRQQQNNERRAAENEQFSKVLIVAEKPSVAKMIAEHLSGGRFRTRRGQSRANQIFEFIKWFNPAQQKCKLMVTSVVGHIFGLSFDGGRVSDIAALFDSKVQKTVADTTKKLRVVEHLQELGQEADYLFLWLDCDREGENIGFEVISLTQDWVHYDNVYRARFSALTKTELIYAYENPVRPDKYAAMCVDARQELDLKIGVSFSRLMTRTFLDLAKQKFCLRDQKVMSYGPCQTPTLWFCVQRHKEIQKFRPSQFFVVSAVVNLQGRNITLKWVEDKVTNQSDLRQMESQIRAARSAIITDVQEETKTVRKPLGLNTVTLLKACSKGLGISPTAAMNAAEHLYTSGYISYPRTETTAYPPSFDLIATLEEQVNHPNWGRIASYLLQSGRINRPDRGQDVGDHPPITPMRSAARDEFNKSSEWRIYDFVTRHFIASLHDEMTYVEKKLIVDVAGYKFQYTWHEIIDKGFMFAMPWKFKSLMLNEARMPPNNVLQSGQPLALSNFLKEEQFTKAPDYLQESELITLMDKHGIGTDASIPQHIKNVQERHYVDVCGPGEDGQRGQIIPQRKFFGKNNNNRGRGGHQGGDARPTSRHMVPRGFGLAFLSCFEELDQELCEPKIRAYMEEQVSKIATGETEKSEVVTSTLKLFHEKFLFFRSNLERVNRFFAPKGQAAGVNAFRGRGGLNHNNYPGGASNGLGNDNFERGRGGSRGGYRGGGRGSDKGSGRGDSHGFENDSFGRGRGGNRGRGDNRGVNRSGDRGASRGNNMGFDLGNERGDFNRGGIGSRGGNRGNGRGSERGGSSGGDRGGYRGGNVARGGYRGGNRGNRGNSFGGYSGRGGQSGMELNGDGFDQNPGQKRGNPAQASYSGKRVHHSY